MKRTEIRSKTLITLALTALLLVTAKQAVAEESQPDSMNEIVPSLSGTYRYAKSLDHGRDILRRVFDDAIDRLSPIMRPLARRKLQSSDPLIRSIVIDLSGERIAVRYVSDKTIDLVSRPGIPEQVEAPNGAEVQLTQHLKTTGLIQNLVGPRGKTKNTLSLTSDGATLSFNTVMTSSLLKGPVVYTLPYKRVSI